MSDNENTQQEETASKVDQFFAIMSASKKHVEKRQAMFQKDVELHNGMCNLLFLQCTPEEKEELTKRFEVQPAPEPQLKLEKNEIN